MAMRLTALAICLWATQAGAQVQAPVQAVWLTVTGSAGEPSLDTIQVDPVPVDVNGEFRTMNLRVSRSAERRSWDGVPYRSYTATVVFDCNTRTGLYRTINFFARPVWQGEPHARGSFSSEAARWVEFRDVHPNPTARIIRAACVGITRPASP